MLNNSQFIGQLNLVVLGHRMIFSRVVLKGKLASDVKEHVQLLNASNGRNSRIIADLKRKAAGEWSQ